MQDRHDHLSRRAFLGALAGAGVAAVLGPSLSAAAPVAPLRRAIPATGETVPVIGMGTWITFDVGDDEALRDDRTEVLKTFFAMGGGVIDSSPMYGSSEAVVGYALKRIANTGGLFAATKVWAPFTALGDGQKVHSRRLWGIERFDLMQIHNLLNWEGHLPRLLEDKAAGRIRYVGITTSHGRRHDTLERVMTEQPLDVVQFTYNIVDRAAEARLLPLAADRGLAVVINRPFRRKQLFEMFARHPLPAWADEIDCANWAQFFLKFIVSHPAVTCAIPATSRIEHMRQNMGALSGRLPDRTMRARMVRYVESL
jgi:diketogulonate reductase-like aldo/keto reductase